MPDSARAILQEDSERRRHARADLDGSIEVSWRDARGQQRREEAKLVDLSESGARLKLPCPIEARSVRLRSEQFGLIGAARVRFCSRSGEVWITGLRFQGELRWRGAALRRMVAELSAKLAAREEGSAPAPKTGKGLSPG